MERSFLWARKSEASTVVDCDRGCLISMKEWNKRDLAPIGQFRFVLTIVLEMTIKVNWVPRSRSPPFSTTGYSTEYKYELLSTLARKSLAIPKPKQMKFVLVLKLQEILLHIC